RGNTSTPIIVRGFDDAAVTGIYNIAAEMSEGSVIESTADILIGTDLAEELEVGVGDRIQVRTPAGVTGDYVIAGLFDFGVGAIDGAWVVTELRTAQNLFGFGDRVTSVEMKVQDIFMAAGVAAGLESVLDNDDLSVSNWQEENEDLLNAIQSQDISSNMIQIVIIISVAIAIASILSISVLQKRRQIGILKAMGIKDRAASLIFVYQGLLIGVLSGVAGIGLGLGLLYAFTVFATTGGESVVAFRLEPLFVVRSLVVAIVASGLAGVIPAWRSLQLTPIEVIREG
ncbi:MAG: ABC transporter permease, partial [Chloroflexota bacterium]